MGDTLNSHMFCLVPEQKIKCQTNEKISYKLFIMCMVIAIIIIIIMSLCAILYRVLQWKLNSTYTTSNKYEQNYYNSLKTKTMLGQSQDGSI